MKRIISLSVCFLLGVGIGWYFGHTRPVVANQRQLLKEYEWARRNVDMSEIDWKETIQVIQSLPKNFEEQYYEKLKSESEVMALIGLATFKNLDRGDTNNAKSRMVRCIGDYYLSYSDEGGDADLLSKIEEAARDYPAIAAEIAKENKGD